MTAVTLDITRFRTLYPQFADDTVYTDTVITDAFNTAVTLLGNDDGAVLPYDPNNGVYTRLYALERATCHILTLDYLQADQPGRLTSATQGSVSTSFDILKDGSGSYAGDWWAQTPCGRAVWLLLLPYIRGGRLYTNNNFHPWG